MSKKVYVILCAVMTLVGVVTLLLLLGVWTHGSLGATLAVLRSDGSASDPEIPIWLMAALVILVFVLPVVFGAFTAVASWESHGIFGRVVDGLLGAPLLGALSGFGGLLMWGVIFFVWSNWQLTLVAVLLLIISALVPTVVVYRVKIERIR